MFTRSRLKLPELTGNDRNDLADMRRALLRRDLSLENPGVLTINNANIEATNGIVFPATQNASTDANTLDDYQEINNQAITVTSSAGTITAVGTATIIYTKIGREVLWQADITITTNGTGSGFITFTFPLTVTGLPPLHGAKATGAALSGYISGTAVVCTNYDGTYPGADGVQLLIGGRCIA